MVLFHTSVLVYRLVITGKVIVHLASDTHLKMIYWDLMTLNVTQVLILGMEGFIRGSIPNSRRPQNQRLIRARSGTLTDSERIKL